MDRNILRSVAADTVESIERLTTKNKLKLSNNYNTEFIKPDEEIDIKDKTKVLKTSYEVLNESIVKTIIDHRDFSNIGVLVFASAKHPCGGFLNGAMAQEEAIAYCSTLYGNQMGKEGSRFYDYNLKNRNKYYNSVMTIGDIEIFKDEKFKLLDSTIKVKAITSAAVNFNYLEKSSEKYNKKEANKIMYDRMERVIDLLIHHGSRTIILGAFGCGVFGNSPQNIANMWYDILEKGRKKEYFDTIIFSVLDNKKTSNYKVFKERFQSV